MALVLTRPARSPLSFDGASTEVLCRCVYPDRCCCSMDQRWVGRLHTYAQSLEAALTEAGLPLPDPPPAQEPR